MMTTSTAPTPTLATVPDSRDPAARDAQADGGTTFANVSPIVAAVDGSDAGVASARAAARMARELDAPLVFVFVRRGPSGIFAGPAYQRRVNKWFAEARRALDAAHAAAEREGISAEEEILEGNPARRVREFAKHRGAQLVVLGSRRRWIGPSVSRAVIRSADRPVLVAGA